METLTIPKEKFSKILDDFEVLITDIESALSEENMIVRKRINDIKENKVEGKTENDYLSYLKKRGIKVDQISNKISS